jgi:hypothetical protein
MQVPASNRASAEQMLAIKCLQGYMPEWPISLQIRRKLRKKAADDKPLPEGYLSVIVACVFDQF